MEIQVVARSEVGKPLIADADHASIDLIDHRVHHRVRRAERSDVLEGVEPVIDPTPAGALA